MVKRILQNLGAIGNGLAELRGLYGTGHGKHGKAAGLRARHAKLAVGAASTLINFLFDTHRQLTASRRRCYSLGNPWRNTRLQSIALGAIFRMGGRHDDL